MPRAVLGADFGPPESYRLVEHDPGAPGPGQVRLAIRAAGISFVDVLTARGEYQVKPPQPFIPGSECAGVIEALGEGIRGLALGDAVVGSNWGEIFAEAVNLRAEGLRPIPAGLSFEEAAVLPVSYATARYALVERAGLRAGESLLVLGAGGATGYAAVQLGKHLGAQVIASASSEDKRALALAGGADIAIDARAEDWRDQVKAACDGKGVRSALPALSASTAESIRWSGAPGRWSGRPRWPNGVMKPFAALWKSRLSASSTLPAH